MRPVTTGLGEISCQAIEIRQGGHRFSVRGSLFLLLVVLQTGCAETDREIGGFWPGPSSGGRSSAASASQRMLNGGARPGGASSGAAGLGGASSRGAATADSAAILATLPSSGCGKPLPLDQVATISGSRTGYTEQVVHVSGDTLAGPQPGLEQDRQFFVRVPAYYDPNRAYRLVYLGQECGPLHAGKTNTYPLFDEARDGTEEAIYVGVSLPSASSQVGCYDQNGAASIEMETFAAMHALVESTYCIDDSRVFAAGYASGAWLAAMYGCYFAGVDPARKFAPGVTLRGQATVAGGHYGAQEQAPFPPCGGPVAGLWIHDLLDISDAIEISYAERDRVLAANGCSDSPTAPWGQASDFVGLVTGVGAPPTSIDCVQYIACPPQYPVVFCTTNGFGHADQSNIAIPGFTRFFDMMGAP